VVRGVTAILLDSGAANLESTIYPLIEATLTDVFFLNQYSTSGVIEAKFVRKVGENIVVLAPGSNGSDTGGKLNSRSSNATKVAVAAAIASCTVVAAVLYGLYKRRNSCHADSQVKRSIAHIQARRRKYFDSLEEDPTLPNGWMVTTEEGMLPPQPTVTWSVSDLTSDAASIISSLPLDRIDEDPSEDIDESDFDALAATVSTDFLSSPEQPELPSVHIEELSFIARWEDSRRVLATEDDSYTEEMKVEESTLPGDEYVTCSGEDSLGHQSCTSDTNEAAGPVLPSRAETPNPCKSITLEHEYDAGSSSSSVEVEIKRSKSFDLSDDEEGVDVEVGTISLVSNTLDGCDLSDHEEDGIEVDVDVGTISLGADTDENLDLSDDEEEGVEVDVEIGAISLGSNTLDDRNQSCEILSDSKEMSTLLNSLSDENVAESIAPDVELLKDASSGGSDHESDPGVFRTLRDGSSDSKNNKLQVILAEISTNNAVLKTPDQKPSSHPVDWAVGAIKKLTWTA
jgi:hypothetical protein